MLNPMLSNVSYELLPVRTAAGTYGGTMKYFILSEFCHIAEQLAYLCEVEQPALSIPDPLRW